MARIELRRTCRHLADAGKAVLVSSHILTELSGLCDAIGVMREGHLVASGPVDEVAQRLRPDVHLMVELADPDYGAMTADLVRGLAGVSEVHVQPDGTVLVTGDLDTHRRRDLLRVLVQGGAPVCGLVEHGFDVEQIMLHLGGEADIRKEAHHAE